MEILKDKNLKVQLSTLKKDNETVILIFLSDVNGKVTSNSK